MSNTDMSNSWTLVGRYIILYVLWLAICGVGFWLIFRIRTNIIEDVLLMRVNPWQLRALDNWLIFSMGAVWIVAVFLIEGYLRRLLHQGRLMFNATCILLFELALIALSYFIATVV